MKTKTSLYTWLLVMAVIALLAIVTGCAGASPAPVYKSATLTNLYALELENLTGGESYSIEYAKLADSEIKGEGHEVTVDLNTLGYYSSEVVTPLPRTFQLDWMKEDNTVEMRQGLKAHTVVRAGRPELVIEWDTAIWAKPAQSEYVKPGRVMLDPGESLEFAGIEGSGNYSLTFVHFVTKDSRGQLTGMFQGDNTSSAHAYEGVFNIAGTGSPVKGIAAEVIQTEEGEYRAEVIFRKETWFLISGSNLGFQSMVLYENARLTSAAGYQIDLASVMRIYNQNTGYTQYVDWSLNGDTKPRLRITNGYFESLEEGVYIGVGSSRDDVHATFIFIDRSMWSFEPVSQQKAQTMIDQIDTQRTRMFVDPKDPNRVIRITYLGLVTKENSLPEISIEITDRGNKSSQLVTYEREIFNGLSVSAIYHGTTALLIQYRTDQWSEILQ